MNYKKLTKQEAREIVARIDSLSDAAFGELRAQWEARIINAELTNDYIELRKKVLAAFEEGKPSGKYEIDLNVGFCLYRELTPARGFTNVIANNDDIWRYLSCVVFPDITYERYPNPAKDDIRLAAKRFYLGKRRIWLKTLWWYIHLSWQGTESETRDVLSGLGTDTISDLIERTGDGYRLTLYREMMRSYSGLENKSTGFFNRLCTQNRINCRSIEPALTQDGERGYVEYMLVQLGNTTQQVGN